MDIDYQFTRQEDTVGIVHPIKISGGNKFINDLKSQLLGLKFEDYMGD